MLLSAQFSFYPPLWWCSITMGDNCIIWSWWFHGFVFYFMLYFITRFLLLQAMSSAALTRSASLLLFSAHTYTCLLLAAWLSWHSLICWQRQVLALAKLKTVWQDRHRFARWRGWTALAFVSDSFCWLFINCVNLPCIPGLLWLSFMHHTDVSCFCAWHGCSGDSSYETHF